MGDHAQQQQQIGGASGNRVGIKNSATDAWRDKMRDEARRVVRERRQQTLERHRSSLSPGGAAPMSAAQHAAMMRDWQADIRAVVAGVIDAGRPGGRNHHNPAMAAAAAAAEVMSRPGAWHRQTSIIHQMDALSAAQKAAAQYDTSEVDAFLAEVEAGIVAELLAELDARDAYEDAAVAAAAAEREALLAAAAAAGGGGVSPICGAAQQQQPQQQQQGSHCFGDGIGSGGAACEPLLCPVCMGAYLAQRAGVVVCPRRCVALNLAAESLSLADLGARLGAAYEEHRATGCSGALAFRQEPVAPGAAGAALTGACGLGCGFFRIVA